MSPRLLLRVGKRNTSWETLTPEDIVRAEFLAPNGDEDLRPSIYEIQPESVTRTEAEHLVSMVSPPPKEGRTSIDLADLAPMTASEGSSLFKLTRDAHGEMLLNDAAQLLAMVRSVRDDLSKRRFVTSREAIYTYASNCSAAGEPEWLAALEKRPLWAEQLARWRKRQPQKPKS